MEMYKRTDWSEKIIWSFYILMGAVFLPVLFCVFFIDKHIKYNETLRIITLLPNSALLAIALLGVAVICLFAWMLRKIELTPMVNILATLVLALLFVGLYFVNVWIAREIAFKFPWDIMIVSSCASHVAWGNRLDYYPYLSIYTNNIPIVYILKKLYVEAMERADYPYVNDFIWIQANCVLLSIGGFFGSLTIKKLTKKIVPTIIYFLLYTVLIGLTPWKTAPYTDTYGLAFPIISIYFYVCYREAKNEAVKYLTMALTLISAAAGGMVKPSIYILMIAILAVELIRFAQDYKKNWKYVLFEVILMVGLLYARGIYTEHMIEEITLDFNDEIGASWQHYFHMGQNGETTGSYSSDDSAIFGEFQTSKKDRNEALWERSLARIREKGFVGNLSFWLKKMTMVFNEGSFGWTNEIWIYEYYPENLARNDHITKFLRDIYWPSMVYTGRFNTFCQLVWIFTLVGMAGFCFLTAEKRKDYVIFAVCFLGIFFYQLLFEARARYLMVFLPLLAVISVSGIWQYAEWGMDWLQKRKIGKQTEK